MRRRAAVVLGWMVAACTPVEAPAPPTVGDAPAGARDAGCDLAAAGCSTKPRQSVRSGAASIPDAGRDQDATAGAAGATAKGQAGALAPAADGGTAGRAGTAGSPPPIDAGTAGAGGSIADAMTPDSLDPDALVRPAESECEYVEVRARSDGAGAPVHVPPGELLQCYLIDAGFEAPTQALEFKALIDHPELIRHMVLRTWERSDVRGPIVDCNETTETHNMVSVWAPGMDDWYFPADMGIDLGRGLFHLEVHYVNTGSAALSDASGMRVCTTKQVRPRTASMSWLGNQAFVIPGGARDYPIRGRCTPQDQSEPIRLLRVAPFTNDLGRRYTMQIDRIDGSTFPLIEDAHTPQRYKSYDTPATLRVGDSILSTCYFDNPNASSVSIGVENGKELCHFFVLAYPAYALVNSPTLSFENNSCLGTP